MNTIISPVKIEKRKELGIKAGDTVRVWQKIKEGDKTRLQAFEGIVLARKHGNEAGATFTVRKVSSGVGVEKIFPLFSPMIDKIEIIRRAKVRRAKLYHIRDKAAKEIKRQMRNMIMVDISTSEEEEEPETVEENVSKEENQVEEDKVSDEKEEEEVESPKEEEIKTEEESPVEEK